MDVKRYDATVEYGPGWDAGAFAVMYEAADGDWVEFTDYATLRAECDLRATIIREIREALGAPSSVLDTDLAGGVRELRAGLDRERRRRADAWASVCHRIASLECQLRHAMDPIVLAVARQPPAPIMLGTSSDLLRAIRERDESRSECDRLRAERDAATREAEICKAIIKHCGGSFVVKCMLCGAPYDVRDPDWLKHDLTCPKHPMRDVERERDALARRMRVVDMRVVACWRSDNTYWLDYPSGRIAPVICALNDDARANGYWPTAGQALDAAATALEAAGLMGEGRDA